jgi:hypothetical protein
MLREEMRRELLKAALARRKVTYGYLMKKFGLTRGGQGRSVVGVLSEIDGVEVSAGRPGFAAIVVRGDTGYPGGGFFCWEGLPAHLRRSRERANDPKLSPEQERYAKERQEEIWTYYRKHTREGDPASDQSSIDE